MREPSRGIIEDFGCVWALVRQQDALAEARAAAIGIVVDDEHTTVRWRGARNEHDRADGTPPPVDVIDDIAKMQRLVVPPKRQFDGL